jgi:hypothetical protein
MPALKPTRAGGVVACIGAGEYSCGAIKSLKKSQVISSWLKDHTLFTRVLAERFISAKSPSIYFMEGLFTEFIFLMFWFFNRRL